MSLAGKEVDCCIVVGTCWLDSVGSRRVQLPHSPMLVDCAIVSTCRRVGVSLGYACPARMIYPNTVHL